jgi:hypothetical protein
VENGGRMRDDSRVAAGQLALGQRPCAGCVLLIFQKVFCFVFWLQKMKSPLWLEEWKLNLYRQIKKLTKSQHFV